MKHYRHRRKRISKISAWIIVIAGILIGTVFTVGIRYSQCPVSKEAAIYTEAKFASYELIRDSLHDKLPETRMAFKDHEPLFIDGVCCSQRVVDKLDQLQPGSVLRMYVHPHSDKILELQDGSTTILIFDDSIEKLSSEISAFLYLGIFLYLIAAYGAYKLIRKETY